MPHNQIRRQREEFHTTYADEVFRRPIKITHRSLKKISQLTSVDAVNLTAAHRSLDEYAKLLGFKDEVVFSQFLLNRSKQLGRKIKIFDAGCGGGSAIDALLKNQNISRVIDRVVGVSIHYFSSLKPIVERHKSQFVFYQGAVQEVLTSMPDEFDFIFDVFGAWHYSNNVVLLLSRYHDALKPGGRAFICPADREHDVSFHEDDCESLLSYLTRSNPNTFSYTEACNTLTCVKTTARFPLSHFNCEPGQQEYARRLDVSFQAMRQGNAIRPVNTMFRLTNPQPMQLRELPYSDKEIFLGAKNQNNFTFL